MPTYMPNVPALNTSSVKQKRLHSKGNPIWWFTRYTSYSHPLGTQTMISTYKSPKDLTINKVLIEVSKAQFKNQSMPLHHWDERTVWVNHSRSAAMLLINPFSLEQHSPRLLAAVALLHAQDSAPTVDPTEKEPDWIPFPVISWHKISNSAQNIQNWHPALKHRLLRAVYMNKHEIEGMGYKLFSICVLRSIIRKVQGGNCRYQYKAQKCQEFIREQKP